MLNTPEVLLKLILSADTITNFILAASCVGLKILVPSILDREVD